MRYQIEATTNKATVIRHDSTLPDVAVRVLGYLMPDVPEGLRQLRKQEMAHNIALAIKGHGVATIKAGSIEVSVRPMQ